MKVLIAMILLLSSSSKTFACEGRSPVVANADLVLKTETMDIYKLTEITQGRGCLEWAVSTLVSKNKLCKDILGKGRFRGYNRPKIEGKISYIGGSLVANTDIETVMGSPGITEILCKVVR